MHLHHGRRGGRRHRPAGPRLAALAGALALFVAACGNTSTPTPSPARTIAPSSSPTTTASPPTSAEDALPTPEAAQVVRITVVSCPTDYAAPGRTTPPIEATTMTATVVPDVAATVTFYSNGELTVLGPKGWRCAAESLADGSARMAITPPDRAWPSEPATPAPDMQAVTAISGGTCVDCVERLACALFPEADRLSGRACEGTLVPSEKIRRPFPRTAVFEDPAGVAGSGDPSGGLYRALGLLVFGTGEEASGGVSIVPSALKVTCTLPEAMAAICDEIIERH